jgi:hypothetical protein
MSDSPDLSKLHARTEQNRIDFLQTDLALCFTFIDLAKTELAGGDREAAMQALANAENGYATIARFAPEVNNPEQRNDIEQKLGELRSALDALA